MVFGGGGGGDNEDYDGGGGGGGGGSSGRVHLGTTQRFFRMGIWISDSFRIVP